MSLYEGAIQACDAEGFSVSPATITGADAAGPTNGIGSPAPSGLGSTGLSSSGAPLFGGPSPTAASTPLFGEPNTIASQGSPSNQASGPTTSAADNKPLTGESLS